MTDETLDARLARIEIQIAAIRELAPDGVDALREWEPGRFTTAARGHLAEEALDRLEGSLDELLARAS